jgi:hypothetical protein
MRRPSTLPAPRFACRTGALAGVVLSLLLPAPVWPQDTPQRNSGEEIFTLPENAYRVELLVFARDDAQALAEEAFDPLPALTYPADYRFLIDPQRADERLAEGFTASRFTDHGVQVLTVATPPSALDTIPRPDSLLDPAPEALLSVEALAPGQEAQAGEAGDSPLASAGDATAATDPAGGDTAVPIPEAPLPDPDAPILAPPYLLLPGEALEFSYQAALLRRRGQEVLFHGAWWSTFEDREKMLPIALDRAGDPDTGGWPRLQGSLLLYLSRYLHAEVDLWLNTAGDYLPAEWQIPLPPVPESSLEAEWRDGRSAPLTPSLPSLNRLLLEARADSAGPTRADGRIGGSPLLLENESSQLPENAGTNVETIDPEVYPYRHAITHRQNRRMRSDELHYIDHPVLAIVLRLRPVTEEDLPLLSPDWLPFLERHQLPVQRWQQEAPKDDI